MKTTLCLAVLLCTFAANAQQFPNLNLEVNGLEYQDGPTAKINMAEVEGIKQYAVNANNDINILLKLVSQLSDVSQIKSKLFTGIERIINQSKDSRSILLLTHSLQAGMTLVKLIDRVAVEKGPAYTPEGTIRQQVRIMKQSLKFAQDYYESDQTFINGVMVKNEVKTNPQFVEFGAKLNAFLIKLSDGLLNAQASYGMIRWSLGVLGHYIQEDKLSGLNYSSTLYHLANALQGKDPSTGFSIYPDLVNLEQGEVAPTDAECILKIRDLKLLYQVSMEGIKTAKEKLEKDKLAAELKAKADEEARVKAEVYARNASIAGNVYKNNFGMEFVKLPGGTFTMGSSANESNRGSDETAHTVTVSSFQMQVTDVTQLQYFKVMGNNPSGFKASSSCPTSFSNDGGGMCPNNPVEQVTWNDAQTYVTKLNSQNDGYTYRLPTEAEWEYAARAGSTTAYSFGDSSSLLGEYAWYNDNSGIHTHEVKSKKANLYGLYDMHGNVWQWVQDWYGTYTSETTNPNGASSGSYRVLRGGSWGGYAQYLCSATRSSGSPGYSGENVGFRLVRTPQ